MIVLWIIVFVVCCGECLGLCLLLLHSRSLSPCVCRVIHAHVSPSPSHVLWCLCVLCEACHMHCVWWLALSNTLPCCAPSSLLFSFCPSLFHHHHQKKNTQGCGEKRGRKEWLGKEKEKEEEERSDAKTSGKGGAKREKDYNTWCSQVVSNPCPNQAQTGFTSLIRREVVLSSWYGRNSLFLSFS